MTSTEKRSLALAIEAYDRAVERKVGVSTQLVIVKNNVEKAKRELLEHIETISPEYHSVHTVCTEYGTAEAEMELNAVVIDLARLIIE